ncbi:GyrI-like domain-containing protein [Paenibacillus hemerocallicola]|uniref:GyrI-like domain-containing protein n=1 Tax=Paenibacillus hemerocallicola TaxID=1172614 RepID=A0A5C4T069_9BACL|nr:GyrI-like domain-containing protein [Paenibacillus hemerocallicola]TNJ62462.1 GyrI-like domain-containing protein [Paenibacillus hemerocallicola]
MSGNKTVLADILQVREVKQKAISLIGLQGVRLEDQHELFRGLESRLNEIDTKSNSYPYLVITPDFRPVVGVEAGSFGKVPLGMIAYTIPADDYVVFRFEKKHIGDFWSNICSNENQASYNIDLTKPRFERFSPELQPSGMVEWHLPVRRT